MEEKSPPFFAGSISGTLKLTNNSINNKKAIGGEYKGKQEQMCPIDTNMTRVNPSSACRWHTI